MAAAGFRAITSRIRSTLVGQAPPPLVKATRARGFGHRISEPEHTFISKRAKAQFKRNSIYSAYFLSGSFLSYALVKPTLDKLKDNVETASTQRMQMKNDIIQHIKQEFEILTVEIEQIISDEILEDGSAETSGHGKEPHGHQAE